MVGTAALAGLALTEWMNDTIDGTTHIFEAVCPELDWSLEHVVGTQDPFWSPRLRTRSCSS